MINIVSIVSTLDCYVLIGPKNYLFLFFFSKNELILKYTEGKPLVRNQQVFNSYATIQYIIYWLGGL